jgi:hypothetical protein
MTTLWFLRILAGSDIGLTSGFRAWNEARHDRSPGCLPSKAATALSPNQTNGSPAMNHTIRSIALSVLAATATLTFAAVSIPGEADDSGMCLQHGVLAAQFYAPRSDGRMVQLGVPGLRSMVFAARP